MLEPSYDEFETLRQDAEFVLSRSRLAGQLRLTLVSERPSPGALARLEHEHELACELDESFAAPSSGLVYELGRPSLLLADPGGELLSSRVGRPWSIADALRVGVGLARALERMHERGLVHRDVKPDNLLVDVASGRVWLLGFGIAARARRGRLAPEDPDIVSGTLAYMAPEQTGRVNRSLDARTDLYACGVTLYELLTGALPFEAADANEWLYAHVAKAPIPIERRTPTVPSAVADIVKKLLSKAPEARYQSATGLAIDLQRCLAAWERSGDIPPFELGLHDAQRGFVAPERLYGRESEAQRLREAYARVAARGRSELWLVTGAAGVGKSRLVNELSRLLGGSGARFASGKAEPQQIMPYATLSRALSGLVQSLLAGSEAKVARARERILAALGGNGRLITGLVPELQLLIGEQAEVPSLPPEESQNRFRRVLRRWLAACAEPEHPLVLFLDDLQWADLATLGLIEDLLRVRDVHHLLLVGAYRDGEVGPEHPLALTLARLRAGGAPVQSLPLEALGTSDVCSFIADMLRCEREPLAPLAALVKDKTLGNPFFVLQFLNELRAEGLLAFEPNVPRWCFELSLIREKGFTQNLVDFVAARLGRLPESTRSALGCLACVGGSASAALLASASRSSEGELHAALWPALQAGLVQCTDDRYAFAHDRVREVAYAHLPEAARASLHHALGLALWAHAEPSEREERLFEIVEQLGRGPVMIREPAERRWAAELALRAGRKAKASAAHGAAVTYLSQGIELLQGCEQEHGELAASLWLELAEADIFSGNFARAEALTERVLTHQSSKLYRATAYRCRVLSSLMQGENARAVERALEGLALLGIEMPARPAPELVQAELDALWRRLEERSIESLAELPAMSNPEMEAAMHVLAALSSAAFFTDAELHCLHLCRMVNLSLDYGTSSASGHAYGYLGMVLGSRYGRYEDAYRLASVACRVVEKHGFRAAEPHVYLMMGLAAIWVQPLATALDYTRAAQRAAVELGDPETATYASTYLLLLMLLRGDPLEHVLTEAERGLELARQVNFEAMATQIRGQQRFVQNLRGVTLAFDTYQAADFDEAAFEAALEARHSANAVATYWTAKMAALFIHGATELAARAEARVAPLSWSIQSSVQWIDYTFFSALNAAARYGAASELERAALREALALAEQRFAAWSENQARTFSGKHALLLAEIARIEGREADAARGYERAIALARNHGFVQCEAIAQETAARFYAERGIETAARAYLGGARYCYARWGARAKVSALERAHPYLAHALDVSLSPTRTFEASAASLSLEAVARVTRALSSEIILEKLIHALLTSALEHAGASRGVLLLASSEGTCVDAEAYSTSTGVSVRVERRQRAPRDVPSNILEDVTRTHEPVIVHDASAPNRYSGDPYFTLRQCRALLCLPLLEQGRLTGVLYLENRLTPYVFTPARLSVLELLAAQAAISLENARLYADLARENQQRRRAEAALRVSEAHLAAAQRLSRTGSFVWNTARGEYLWSEEMSRIAGYSPSELPLPPERGYERVHPDDADHVRGVIAAAVRQAEPFTFEERLVMPDGSIRNVRVRAEPSRAEDGTLEYRGALQDITAEREAQRALESAFREVDALKEELRLAVDTIPELVWTALPDGSCDFVNQRVRQYTGQEVADARKSGWLLALHPDDRAGLLEIWERALEDGSPARAQARLRRHDGEYRRFAFHCVPLHDEHGRVVKWYGSTTDIEDRLRAEEALQQAQAELAHVTRVTTLGELAASIAHEINQPLAAMVANAHACINWLARGNGGLEEVREALAAIVNDGDRAAQVIVRIRALLARSSPLHVTCDVAEVVRGVLPLARPALSRPGITLETQIAPEPLLVSGDAVQLQQVLLNLLLNAVEASNGLPAERLRIVVSAAVEQGAGETRVVVSVEDAGVGLPAGDRSELFSPFYSTKPGGLGMGLSISRSIIDRHGGKLWCTPNPHHGATFHFYLPRIS